MASSRELAILRLRHVFERSVPEVHPQRRTWLDVFFGVHVRIFRNHGGDVEALPRGFDGGDPGLEDAPGPRHGRAVRVDEEERPDGGWQEDGFREGRLEDVATELTLVRNYCRSPFQKIIIIMICFEESLNFLSFQDSATEKPQDRVPGFFGPFFKKL